MSGEGAMALAGSRCALHPDVTAEITCRRCGNFACAQCIANPNAASPVCRECAARSGPQRYYVVPPTRVVALYVLTAGSYGLWWFYKNWSAIKRRDGSSIWPAARAIFGPVSFFSLVTDLNQQSRQRALSSLTDLGTGSALGFFAANMLIRLPDPGWLISLLGGFFLFPAAQRIVELEGAEALEANRPLRMRHYVLGVCLIIMWSLIILGMMMPDK